MNSVTRPVPSRKAISTVEVCDDFAAQYIRFSAFKTTKTPKVRDLQNSVILMVNCDVDHKYTQSFGAIN